MGVVLVKVLGLLLEILHVYGIAQPSPRWCVSVVVDVVVIMAVLVVCE